MAAADRLTTVYPGASSSQFPPYEYDPDKARQLLEEAGYDYDFKINPSPTCCRRGDGPEPRKRSRPCPSTSRRSG